MPTWIFCVKTDFWLLEETRTDTVHLWPNNRPLATKVWLLILEGISCHYSSQRLLYCGCLPGLWGILFGNHRVRFPGPRAAIVPVNFCIFYHSTSYLVLPLKTFPTSHTNSTPLSSSLSRSSKNGSLFRTSICASQVGASEVYNLLSLALAGHTLVVLDWWWPSCWQHLQALSHSFSRLSSDTETPCYCTCKDRMQLLTCRNEEEGIGRYMTPWTGDLCT